LSHLEFRWQIYLHMNPLLL